LRVLMDKALRLGLRPVAAGGTSPPLGGTGLSLALCTRASDRGPLPAAVEAHQESPMSDLVQPAIGRPCRVGRKRVENEQHDLALLVVQDLLVARHDVTLTDADDDFRPSRSHPPPMHHEILRAGRVAPTSESPDGELPRPGRSALPCRWQPRTPAIGAHGIALARPQAKSPKARLTGSRARSRKYLNNPIRAHRSLGRPNRDHVAACPYAQAVAGGSGHRRLSLAVGRGLLRR